MASYWPFLRFYGPKFTRDSYTHEKKTRPISSHLDRTRFVSKGFIIWHNFLRDTMGIPPRWDRGWGGGLVVSLLLYKKCWLDICVDLVNANFE